MMIFGCLNYSCDLYIEIHLWASTEGDSRKASQFKFQFNNFKFFSCKCHRVGVMASKSTTLNTHGFGAFVDFWRYKNNKTSRRLPNSLPEETPDVFIVSSGSFVYLCRGQDRGRS